MYRVRFHGRGGQGMKTASRVLGTALFLEGFEVQDAPRYGAERRGAPIFAYVRADTKPIHERGIIGEPDLVVVADETLVNIAAAGVLQGLTADTVLLIISNESETIWRERLHSDARIVVLPSANSDADRETPPVSAACAGAAARLIGKVGKTRLVEAIEKETGMLGQATVAENTAHAVAAFDAMEGMVGCVVDGAAARRTAPAPPNWVDLAFEPADISAPTIHAGLTSMQVRTGLWRTLRPVLDKAHCNKCVWVCGSVCPDGVISADTDGYPAVDYDHCKGCMICVSQCPHHALAAIGEQEAAQAETATTKRAEGSAS